MDIELKIVLVFDWCDFRNTGCSRDTWVVH